MAATFQGSIVALPTPFQDGQLDLDAFRKMVDDHVRHRTSGIVVSGTTGEAPTLSEHERRTLIHAAVEFAAGRLPVLAGVGSNQTSATVELARFAGACGADGLLVVTPYYNRPSRRGLLRHFGAVAEATGVPIVLYNVPGRTGVDLAPDLASELGRRHSNIVGIKESSGDRDRMRAVIEQSGLDVFCGEDQLIVEFMQHGAVGAVNVVGNLVPDEIADLIACSRPGGDSNRAAELFEFLTPLIRDLFIEVNPVPVKAALEYLSRCNAEVRAPLAELEDEHRDQLEATLRSCGALLPPPSIAR